LPFPQIVTVSFTNVASSHSHSAAVLLQSLKGIRRLSVQF